MCNVALPITNPGTHDYSILFWPHSSILFINCLLNLTKTQDWLASFLRSTLFWAQISNALYFLKLTIISCIRLAFLFFSGFRDKLIGSSTDQCFVVSFEDLVCQPTPHVMISIHLEACQMSRLSFPVFDADNETRLLHFWCVASVNVSVNSI